MLINHRAVPPEISVRAGTSQSFTTTQGTYKSSKIFYGQKIFFPIFANLRVFLKFNLGFLIYRVHVTMSSSAVTY